MTLRYTVAERLRRKATLDTADNAIVPQVGNKIIGQYLSD